MAVGSANGIRAGMAYVEITTKNSLLVTGLKKAQESLRNFANSVQMVGGNFLRMSGLFAVPVTLATKTFAEFDDQMRITQAISGATTDSLAELTAKARELGATTAFTATQVAEGQVSLARMGFNADEIKDSIGSILNLTRATGEGTYKLGEIALIAGNAMRIFKKDSLDIPKISDTIAYAANHSAMNVGEFGEALRSSGNIAYQTHESLKDLAATFMIMANAGVRGELAGTAYRKMMTKLTEPKIIERLEGMGIKVKDLNGNLRKSYDILADLAPIMATMGTAEKLQLSEELFDLRGMFAGTNIAQNTEDLRKFRTALDKDTFGYARRKADDMEKGIGGTFRMLMSRVNDACISIGDSVANMFKGYFDAFTNMLKGIREWIDANKPLVSKIMAVAASTTVLGVSLVALGLTIRAVAFAMSPFIATLDLAHKAVVSFCDVTVGLIRLPDQIGKAFKFMALIVGQSVSKITPFASTFKLFAHLISLQLGLLRSGFMSLFSGIIDIGVGSFSMYLYALLKVSKDVFSGVFFYVMKADSAFRKLYASIAYVINLRKQLAILSVLMSGAFKATASTTAMSAFARAASNAGKTFSGTFKTVSNSCNTARVSLYAMMKLLGSIITSLIKTTYSLSIGLNTTTRQIGILGSITNDIFGTRGFLLMINYGKIINDLKLKFNSLCVSVLNMSKIMATSISLSMKNMLGLGYVVEFVSKCMSNLLKAFAFTFGILMIPFTINYGKILSSIIIKMNDLRKSSVLMGTFLYNVISGLIKSTFHFKLAIGTVTKQILVMGSITNSIFGTKGFLFKINYGAIIGNIIAKINALKTSIVIMGGLLDKVIFSLLTTTYELSIGLNVFTKQFGILFSITNSIFGKRGFMLLVNYGNMLINLRKAVNGVISSIVAFNLVGFLTSVRNITMSVLHSLISFESLKLIFGGVRKSLQGVRNVFDSLRSVAKTTTGLLSVVMKPLLSVFGAVSGKLLLVVGVFTAIFMASQYAIKKIKQGWQAALPSIKAYGKEMADVLVTAFHNVKDAFNMGTTVDGFRMLFSELKLIFYKGVEPLMRPWEILKVTLLNVMENVSYGLQYGGKLLLQGWEYVCLGIVKAIEWCIDGVGNTIDRGKMWINNMIIHFHQLAKWAKQAGNSTNFLKSKEEREAREKEIEAEYNKKLNEINNENIKLQYNIDNRNNTESNAAKMIRENIVRNAKNMADLTREHENTIQAIAEQEIGAGKKKIASIEKEIKVQQESIKAYAEQKQILDDIKNAFENAEEKIANPTDEAGIARRNMLEAAAKAVEKIYRTKGNVAGELARNKKISEINAIIKSVKKEFDSYSSKVLEDRIVSEEEARELNRLVDKYGELMYKRTKLQEVQSIAESAQAAETATENAMENGPSGRSFGTFYAQELANMFRKSAEEKTADNTAEISRILSEMQGSLDSAIYKFNLGIMN